MPWLRERLCDLYDWWGYQWIAMGIFLGAQWAAVSIGWSLWGLGDRTALLGLVTFLATGWALVTANAALSDMATARFGRRVAAGAAELVIRAYGAVLEEVASQPERHAVYPESKLPYAKPVI